MQMHNPRSKDPRPLLPGQRFPGLGLGRKVGQVMEDMALDSKVTDGLLNFPFYWHLAVACMSLIAQTSLLSIQNYNVCPDMRISRGKQILLEAGVTLIPLSKHTWRGSPSK